jgi:predicted DNA-binding transcriptional regulator AlpA
MQISFTYSRFGAPRTNREMRLRYHSTAGAANNLKEKGMTTESDLKLDLTRLGDDTFLTRKDMLAMFGISKATLHRYLRAGKIPAPNRVICEKPYWRVADFRDWMRGGTSKAA